MPEEEIPIDIFKDQIPILSYEELIKQENIFRYPRIIGGILQGGQGIFGSGDNILRFDEQNGLWMGNAKFSNAPFGVSMAGALTCSSLTLTGGTIKYGKTSFADSTNAGYYLGSEGIYVGSAADASVLKYTISSGVFDFIGTISSRSTATIATAINASGNLVTDLINARLDSSAKTILDSFSFGASGAIQIGTYSAGVSGDIKISPSGIVGRNSAGANTFTIDGTTGNATFAGTLSAAAGTLGTITSATITGGTIALNSANAITIDYGGSALFKHGGNINFTSVTAPTACTATLITAAGNVDIGTHIYKVTYVNSTGETELGTASNTVTTDVNNRQVALSAIPVSSSTSVTARKVYRTKAGGTVYHLLATIADNTTTTYTDNIADASLPGTDANSDFRPNETAGGIKIDGIISGRFGKNNTFLGYSTGFSNTDGYRNTALGTYALYSNTTGNKNSASGYKSLYANTVGYENLAIGDNSLSQNTAGFDNVAVGYAALYSNVAGGSNVAIGNFTLWNSTRTPAGEMKNTAIGYAAGYGVVNGIGNVFLGYKAGYYETGSDKLFIDNRIRTDEADGRTKALFYGVFAAATADQKLTINGLLNQSVSKTPASAAAVGTAGDIAWDASYIYVCTATDTWKRVGIATW